jgi:NAD(P)-dependent dehydrogenase (short-subunit alcohol dehydrogenase family)
MAGRLSGRAIIVTGAAQGIGAAYAKALAAEGARVSLSDLQAPEATLAAIRKAGGEAIATACDVTDAKSVARMVQETERAFGGVQVLVNNAAMFGQLALKRLEQIDSDEWDRVMSVNVRGTFECIKAVLPAMRRQKYGKIINVASGTVFKGTPMLLHYVTSKGAVVALTRSVARECGDDGIRCNCIAPGLTMSESVKANSAWAQPIVSANIASRCLKREETADDLLGTIVFLSAADSDFMTGQTIVIDGGSVTH